APAAPAGLYGLDHAAARGRSGAHRGAWRPALCPRAVERLRGRFHLALPRLAVRHRPGAGCRHRRPQGAPGRRGRLGAVLTAAHMRSLLVAAPLAGWPLVGRLFPGVAPTVVTPDTLRVSRPWRGELFDLLAAAALEALRATPRADFDAAALEASGVPAASSLPPAD